MLAGLLFLSVVVGIFVELAIKSAAAWRMFGLAFLWHADWNPVTRSFGALSMIYGSVVSSAIAIVLAATVGVLGAAYLADLAPRAVARPLFATIELLAAVPSVVFGLWGLFVLAPLMRTAVDPLLRHAFGFLPAFRGTLFGTSLLTAGIILAIMIIPTVLVLSYDVIRSVPEELREASISLGATPWETLWRVVLPAARGGVFGACVLALGRALGETIAVMMVIGNKPAIAPSLFAPAYTLTSVIANEFAEATSALYRSSLFAIGFTLFVVSMITNAAGRFLTMAVWRSRRGRGDER